MFLNRSGGLSMQPLGLAQTQHFTRHLSRCRIEDTKLARSTPWNQIMQHVLPPSPPLTAAWEQDLDSTKARKQKHLAKCNDVANLVKADAAFHFAWNTWDALLETAVDVTTLEPRVLVVLSCFLVGRVDGIDLLLDLAAFYYARLCDKMGVRGELQNIVEYMESNIFIVIINRHHHVVCLECHVDHCPSFSARYCDSLDRKSSIWGELPLRSSAEGTLWKYRRWIL